MTAAKRRVLLADDEQMIRRLVAETIENEDYELLQASNGEEALRLVREEHPDLVLLDVRMPGSNGLEVCRAIKSSPETAGTIVVMLTATAPEELPTLPDVGPDEYFTKPFSPIELIATLERLLRR